jgi:hypothetical protein
MEIVEPHEIAGGGRRGEAGGGASSDGWAHDLPLLIREAWR